MKSEIKINLNEICRLCVETIPTSNNNGKLIHIFQNNEECSLPIRIMACSALEVQESDSLPKHICLDCRKMLEKFYYFRTKCKNSDTKLRRHLRLVNAGKQSNVFTMDPDEDEHEDDYMKSRQLFKQWDEEENITKEAESCKREEVIEQEKQEAVNSALEKERKRLELEELKRMEEWKHTWEKKFHHKNQLVKKKQLSEERKLNQMRKNLQVAAEAAAKDLQIVNEHLKAVKAIQDFGEEGDEDDDSDVRNLNLSATNSNNEMFTNVEHSVDSHLKIIKKTAILKPKTENHDPNKFHITQVVNANENPESNEDEENIVYNPSGSISIVASQSIGSDDETGSHIQITNKLFSLKTAKCENTDEVTYELTETGSDNYDAMDANGANDESYEFAVCDKQIKSDGGDYHVTEYLDDDYNMVTGSDAADDVDSGGSGGISGGNHDNSIDHGDVGFQDTESFIPVIVGNNSEEYNDDIEEDQYEDEKSVYKLDQSISSQNDLVFVEMNNYRKVEAVSDSFPGDNTVQSGGGKLYGCVKCKKTFPRVILLKHHMAQHDKKPSGGEACTYCDRVFQTKTSLRRHFLIHTGEKPFKCEICGRAFIQKEILKRHYLVHTGDRPYKCDLCDRSFTQREMLRQHMNRVHTENPEIIIHACPKCSKTFQHASGLSRHILIHSGVKFDCEYCLREFNDKSALKRHILALHSPTITGV